MSERLGENPEVNFRRPIDSAPAVGAAVMNTVPTGAKERGITPNGLCPAYMAEQRKLREFEEAVRQEAKNKADFTLAA